MEKQLPARIDEVVAAEISDTPGSLAKTIKALMENKVNVDYMYALSGNLLRESRHGFQF